MSLFRRGNGCPAARKPGPKSINEEVGFLLRLMDQQEMYCESG